MTRQQTPEIIAKEYINAFLNSFTGDIQCVCVCQLERKPYVATKYKRAAAAEAEKSN